MRTRLCAVYCFLFLSICIFPACKGSEEKTEKPEAKDTSAENKGFTSPPHYNLNEPVTIKLPPSLDEISGINYYPKDTSVFGIEDEDGIFSKVFLNGAVRIKTWRFDKKHDYEDIVRIDSTFYILISNGDIAILKFDKDSLKQEKITFGAGGKKVNEFEIIYYDDQLRKIVMMCKECEDDKNAEVTAYGFDPVQKAFTGPLYKLNVKAIEEKAKIKKLELKPSGAAIHPITGELYIISAVSDLLVIADRNGTIKEAHKIDKSMFNQPEGIAFTPSGSMLISNELGERDNARILIFKYLK